MDWKRGWICVLLIAFCGCAKDDGLIVETERVNAWIHRSMTRYYLWSGEMRPMGDTDRSPDPASYFDSEIRYRADHTVPYFQDTYGDRFSYLEPVENADTRGMESLSAGRDRGFGFEARLFVLPNAVYSAQVIYVVPGTPADRAGLRRGEEFSAITAGGTRYDFPVDRSLYTAFMERYSEITLRIDYPEPREITLASGEYSDTPILFDTIYNTSPRTAYLVYNHFTTGENDCFLNQLNGIFQRFRAAGARNLILDLRYNPGGELAAARHLASLMVRRDLLGQIFVYKENNGCIGNPSRFVSERLLASPEVGDYNMDARRICIITSSGTASASELLLHGLRPYYGSELIHVGQTTVGKNLGGVKVADKRYLWELHPITIRIYNKNKISGYEQGIEPDGEPMEEFYPRQHISGVFGDAGSDPLLREALLRITDGTFPAVSGLRGLPESVSGSGSLPAGITAVTTFRQRPLIDSDPPDPD